MGLAPSEGKRGREGAAERRRTADSSLQTKRTGHWAGAAASQRAGGGKVLSVMTGAEYVI